MEFKGKIRVLTESEKVLVDVENTITTLFEEIVASGGIDVPYCLSSAIEAGQTILQSRTHNFDGGNSYLSYIEKSYLITVYFLNLSDTEKKSLNKDSYLLPIYTNSYEIDESKIVGYANAVYTATSPKQGYVIPLDGINLVNPRKHGLKFKWDAEVLQGSYNCIAVGLNVIYDRFSGVRLHRGLEYNNVAVGEANAQGYYIRPNVKTLDNVVYTGENEILLGNAVSPTKARKVLNLQTGKEILLSNQDYRYDFPLIQGYGIQIVNGNNLIYNEDYELKHINLSTKEVKRIASSVRGAFIYDGYLYAIYSTSIIRAYDLKTFSYTSSKNLNISNMNIPTEFLGNSSKEGYLQISNVGDNFLIVCGYIPNNNLLGYKKMGIICSDIMDVKNSIIDIVPETMSAAGFEMTGKKYFTASKIPSSLSYRNNYNYLNIADSQFSIEKTGLKFTTEGMYGNLFSFHTFEESQQIPTGEGLKLEYYYTFEQ